MVFPMFSKLSRTSVKIHLRGPHFSLWFGLGKFNLENDPLKERLFTFLDWHGALFCMPVISKRCTVNMHMSLNYIRNVYKLVYQTQIRRYSIDQKVHLGLKSE